MTKVMYQKRKRAHDAVIIQGKVKGSLLDFRIIEHC